MQKGTSVENGESNMCTVLGVSVLATSSHTHLQTLLLADRVLALWVTVGATITSADGE